MKYLKQFGIILLISLIGELLSLVIPFKFPGSVYGMIIMFTCLLLKIVKLEDVKDVAKIFIEIMPLLFVPAGVGLMASWGILKPVLVPVLVVTIVSLFAVMIISGWISQIIIRMENKSKEEEIS